MVTSPYTSCPVCRGSGYIHPPPAPHAWLRCAACDGIGTTWEVGAPGYGCSVHLSDRDPGEIVELGNGFRCRILWHMPRKTKKVTPITTFVGLIDEFTDFEHQNPIAMPSCMGVSTVEASRAAGDTNAHANSRTIDLGDPVHRQVAGRLV